ncbi:hypothetical protein KIK04_01325 [Paenibacillus sp. 481]|nr:hypothetical protein KIK04_01325 [Paenibacillus sp. 481]
MLSEKELFFLTGIVGSERLLGVDDPFRGYLTEEIEAEWDKAKASLLEKGYILPQPNSYEYTMPAPVYDCMTITGLAEHACWVRYSHDMENFEGYVHVTQEQVVERIRLSASSEDIRLSMLGDTHRAWPAIVERMNWLDTAIETEAEESSVETAHSLPSVMLSKKLFHTFYEQVDNFTIDQLADVMNMAPEQEEGARAFATSMKQRTSEGEMMLFVWTERGWDVQGFAFLIGGSYNWLIRRSSRQNEDWLTATPTTKSQFIEMLIAWERHSISREGR